MNTSEKSFFITSIPVNLITRYSLQRYLIALAFGLSILISSASQAVSSISIDNETGYILEGQNRNSKVPVAGLTKMALAVVLLDWSTLSKTSLETVVEVPPNALPQGSHNPIGLQSGDRLTLRDLLYLSLMVSDDEAARTIAEAVGQRLPNSYHLDAIGNFVSQMNALAAQLEMKHTLFLNPSGHNGNSGEVHPYSSAADLARLTRYAYSKPGLSFYVSQKSRDIHLDRQGQSMSVKINNTNRLLGIENIDGTAIAHTQETGGSMVLTSALNPEVKRVGDTVFTTPRRIIVILLDDNNFFVDGLNLHHRGWSLYKAWAAAGRPLKPGTFL